MAGKSKIFALLPTEKQIETINAWCFRKCGQIIFGGLTMDLGDEGSPVELECFACRTVDCPVVDREIDEPVGDMDGDPVYIRKLKEDLDDEVRDDDGQVTVRTSSLTVKDFTMRPCGNTDCHYHEESVVLSHCDRHAIEDVTSCDGYGDKLEYIPPDFS